MKSLSSPRDNRIDILRGFAMLTIAINHVAVIPNRLGFDGWEIPTLTQHGYSGSAEIFVLLSGYMVGIVYLRKNNSRALLIKRALKLYLYNFIVLLICMIMAFALDYDIISVSGLSYFVNNPLSATLSFLAFGFQPLFLDVLALYVILMIASALVVPQLKDNPLIVIFASVALYASVHIFRILGVTLNLPGGIPETDMLWTFNPFSWQLLFVLGLLAGRVKFLSTTLSFLEHNRVYLFVAPLLLAVSTLVYTADTLDLVDIPFTGKTDLAPTRIVHAFIVVGTLISVMVYCKSLTSGKLFQWVGEIGSQTLNCYLISIVANYAFAQAWILGGSTQEGFLLMAVSMILLMAFTARMSNLRRMRSRPPLSTS